MLLSTRECTWQLANWWGNLTNAGIYLQNSLLLSLASRGAILQEELAHPNKVPISFCNMFYCQIDAAMNIFWQGAKKIFLAGDVKIDQWEFSAAGRMGHLEQIQCMGSQQLYLLPLSQSHSLFWYGSQTSQSKTVQARSQTNMNVFQSIVIPWTQQ